MTSSSHTHITKTQMCSVGSFTIGPFLLPFSFPPSIPSFVKCFLNICSAPYIVLSPGEIEWTRSGICLALTVKMRQRISYENALYWQLEWKVLRQTEEWVGERVGVIGIGMEGFEVDLVLKVHTERWIGLGLMAEVKKGIKGLESWCSGRALA